MARFTIVGPFLYALHDSYIQLVRIDDPVNPSLWSKVDVGWGIETIFPYGNYLFIGSTTGMFIYDNTDPENPTPVSAFAHVTSCYPVVAQGDYAYVTLRSGTSCGGGENRLDILDITDLTNPLMVQSYAMQGSFGLGIDGATLFVCDGVAGLKVYDISGLYVGVPAQLGAKGVEKVWEIKLTDEEGAALKKSAAAVKELVEIMKL